MCVYIYVKLAPKLCVYALRTLFWFLHYLYSLLSLAATWASVASPMLSSTPTSTTDVSNKQSTN